MPTGRRVHCDKRALELGIYHGQYQERLKQRFLEPAINSPFPITSLVTNAHTLDLVSFHFLFLTLRRVRVSDVTARAGATLLVQNPAKGDHDDATDEADILEDIVGLYALASASQLALVFISGNATENCLSDTRATAVEQFVLKTLGVANLAIAGATVYTSQREGQGLVLQRLVTTVIEKGLLGNVNSQCRPPGRRWRPRHQRP